jgi:hypothetical protein
MRQPVEVQLNNMTNQKGSLQLVVVVIIVLGVLVGGYLVSQRTNFLPNAKNNNQTFWQTPHKVNEPKVDAINNDTDLMETADLLESEDIDKMDNDLMQNEKEAGGL